MAVRSVRRSVGNGGSAISDRAFGKETGRAPVGQRSSAEPRPRAISTRRGRRAAQQRAEQLDGGGFGPVTSSTATVSGVGAPSQLGASHRPQPSPRHPAWRTAARACQAAFDDLARHAHIAA